MIAIDYGFSTSVYSLPGLQLRHRIQSRMSQLLIGDRSCPRADDAGVVYVPYARYISMLEISDSGNVTELGRLTAQGRRTEHLNVAAGPRPGQLCVVTGSSKVSILNVTIDSIIHTLVAPSGIDRLRDVATLPTGEILAADQYGGLVWYRSVTDPALLLTDTPAPVRQKVVLGNINQFLVATFAGPRLYVLSGARTWHSIEALNGKDGVWVPHIWDVAVWESCVWVAERWGSLVLLCPV